MKHIITCLTCVILLSVNTYSLWVIHKKIAQLEHPPKVECIKLEQPEFLTQEVNDSIMLMACEYYGIKHPKHVTAQAILESGHFKSKVFREYNNPFGLYNSKTNDYFKFQHWSDAILGYKNMIEYRHREGEDYLNFLSRIGYASDTLYNAKIISLMSKLPP